MITKWDDNTWRKEFLEMKFHSPADVKQLNAGLKGLIDTWRLGVLNLEYKRLKNIKEDND